MSYSDNSMSVPKKLFNDKKLKDFDIRLYLIIAERTNEHGYSRITNDTLSHLTGKKETAIKDAINSLVKHEYLFRKLNARKNDIYEQDYKRVLWLIEPYRSYKWSKQREKKQRPKTVMNDKKLFVEFLRTDCKGMEFPLEIGGLYQTYSIHQDNLIYLHVKGEYPTQLDSFDANEVFKHMFKQRNSLMFQKIINEQTSLSFETLVKRANENNNNGEV